MLEPEDLDRRMEARRAAARARRRRQVARRRAVAFAVLVLALVAAVRVVAGDAPPATTQVGTTPATSAGTGAGDGRTGTGEAPADTSEEPPATQPGPPRGTVTFAAVGDTVLGNTPVSLPPSPATYLDAMAPALADADVVFGNYEGTFTDATASKCGSDSTSCFAFRTPPAFARHLARDGFDVLSVANNHAFDFWDQGFADTRRAIRRAGMQPVGAPGESIVLRAGDIRVGVVAFATYPTYANLLDTAAARRLIERAVARSDVTMLSMHVGAEGTEATHVTGAEEVYVGENRGNPQAFARMAVDLGVDLVVGHGPHVVRGMELYRRRLIAYSLGNFAGYENFSTDGILALGVVLRARLAADGRFLGGRIISTRQSSEGRPAIDPAGEAAALVEQLSQADFGPRAVRVGAGGRIAPPRR
jgi:hypothetical protein